MIKKLGRPIQIDRDAISPVARLILERCDDLGWSITDLAKRMGAPPNNVGRALRRESPMFGLMIEALGGLRHERHSGHLVAVWGETA